MPFLSLHLQPTTPTPPPPLSTLTSINSHPILAPLPSPTREALLSLELLGVDTPRALLSHPSLLSATPVSIHAVLAFLTSKGVPHADLPRVLAACPSILTADVRTDLVPVFRFLETEMGLGASPRMVGGVVRKCPRLVVESVRDQLRPALGFLERLGFGDRRRLVVGDPHLLVSSVERTLIPKLNFLQQDGLGFTREEAIGMVLRCPGLFTFSIEKNFKPKHAFFLEQMHYRSREELREFPQYFAFSLEKRIKPRHQRLMETGKLNLPLPLLLKSTNDEFELMLNDTP